MFLAQALFLVKSMKLARIIFLLLISFLHGSFQATALNAQELEHGKYKVIHHFESDTLTGDWKGLRTRLYRKGVDFEVEYFGDLFSLVSGGLDRRTDFTGLLELELHLDGDRLLGWQGSRFFIFGIGSHGNDFLENVGSTHDVSSIAAPDTFKFLELWYEQSFLEDQLSVLIGLYDLTGEFDIRPTAQLFVNGAFGSGRDLTETGKNGPSTFPATSLATRIKVKPIPSLYYMGAVLDGVPGDPTNRTNGTQIDLNSDDGLLIANEIGYESPAEKIGLNKAGIGAWIYTTDLDDLVRVDANGNSVKQSGTYGVYAFVDGAIFLEEGSASSGLYSFFRIGIAEEDVNKIDLYLDGGLVYQGLFPDRPKDKMGLAVSMDHFSEGFKQKQEKSQVLIEETEVLLELTYHYNVGSGIFFQPDFQYVFNPAQLKGASNAASIGFRFMINL